MVRNVSWVVLALVIVALASLTTYYVLTSPQQVIRLRVSTTTSLYATGLLDYLASAFSEAYPDVRVEFIAGGTGAALKIAEQGDVCVVLVHAPSLEKQYLERRVIEGGKIFAYNYFVLVGPASDPANVSGAADIVSAFRRIYSAGESGDSSFVSRGDESGTHVRELRIWREAGLDPRGTAWYRDCGCGMSEALIMASELHSYTLSDLGTYLTLKKAGRVQWLETLYVNENDALAVNIYSAYVVSGCRGDERRYAELFVDFIYANQEALMVFSVSKYGEPLLHSVRGRELEIQNLWSLSASEQR
ncbi:MAG: substrate-binding domain-containing protein [Zestosphaera sp.]